MLIVYEQFLFSGHSVIQVRFSTLFLLLFSLLPSSLNPPYISFTGSQYYSCRHFSLLLLCACSAPWWPGWAGPMQPRQCHLRIVVISLCFTPNKYLFKCLLFLLCSAPWWPDSADPWWSLQPHQLLRYTDQRVGRPPRRRVASWTRHGCLWQRTTCPSVPCAVWIPDGANDRGENVVLVSSALKVVVVGEGVCVAIYSGLEDGVC